MLTPRERFKAVINFKKPDVLPWVEEFSDSHVVQWFEQGLPAPEIEHMNWEIIENGGVDDRWVCS